MKKNLGIVVLTCFLLIGLASCMNGLDSSSIELSFDKSIFSSARNAETDSRFLIAVTLSDGDGYDETQVLGENDISQSVVFKELPIGAHVEADVKVFTMSEDPHGSFFYSVMQYQGSTDFIIERGKANVCIKLHSVPENETYDYTTYYCYDDDITYTCHFYPGNYYSISFEDSDITTQCFIGLYTGDVNEPGTIYMKEIAYRAFHDDGDSGNWADSYTIIHNPEKQVITIDSMESGSKYFDFSSRCGKSFYLVLPS